MSPEMAWLLCFGRCFRLCQGACRLLCSRYDRLGVWSGSTPWSLAESEPGRCHFAKGFCQHPNLLVLTHVAGWQAPVDSKGRMKVMLLRKCTSAKSVLVRGLQGPRKHKRISMRQFASRHRILESSLQGVTIDHIGKRFLQQLSCSCPWFGRHSHEHS